MSLENNNDLKRIHFIMYDCVRYEDKIKEVCEHSKIDKFCDGCNEYKPRGYGRSNR